MDQHMERICSALEKLAAQHLTYTEWAMKKSGFPPMTEERENFDAPAQAEPAKPVKEKRLKATPPTKPLAPAPLPPGVDITNLRQSCRDLAMHLAQTDRPRLDTVLASFKVVRISEIPEAQLPDLIKALQ